MLKAIEIGGKVFISQNVCPHIQHIHNILLENNNVTLETVQWKMAELVLASGANFNNEELRLAINWLSECQGMMDRSLYDLLKQKGMPEV